MNQQEFKEQIYELAFGKNAINRDFSEEEVLERMKEFTELSHQFENLRQGSILYDKESFVALVCSQEDIEQQIKAGDEATNEEKQLAKSMINSDYFRSKFTDIIMNDFWETIDCIYDDKGMMIVIEEETIKNV